MFNKVVKKVMGEPGAKLIKRFRVTVEEINALEGQMQALSDAAMRAKTEEFKQRLGDGETLNDLLPEAYALVREAGVRTTGLRIYDVQMIGGMVLHHGRIAEMRTGEGKTLVATLPLYLNALEGKGVHLVTPNDYLSKVGLQTMGPVYHFLGLSSAVIQSSAGDPDAGSFLFDPEYDSDDARFQNLQPVRRREAYQADITYGTNNEFGFDYLRDNMITDLSEKVQGELNFAIVDEVDNILIDEARTPLIISGQADAPSDYYKTFAQIVRTLRVSSDESVDLDEPDGDFVMDVKDRIVYLTEAGVEKVERALGIEQLYSPEHSEMIPYLDNCLRAQVLFENDKEYIVQGGQVIIVDEFTGRLMYGRRFSEGLHQAIEAKEGVEIRRENLTMATITFQNFFRMYNKLSGMTGTAMTESEEFLQIYNLEPVPIPTHRPVIRKDEQDYIFMNEDVKFKAVVEEIKERQEIGQPVLVGTVAIETSERLGKALKRAGVSHEVLNAKQHEREAVIISQAGRPGAVTIATNMAGRGVDILLGGNPDGLAREMLQKQGVDVTEASEEQWQSAFDEAKAQTDRNREHVLEVGGLYVLGTERHEARRIDNQLRGRSGRQGDPGESRFFLSLEDDLMKRFGGDRVKSFMSWANIAEDEPIEHGMISKSIGQAQVRVEGYNFDIRKRVLEYDDVVNKQRTVIYAQRNEILRKDSLRADLIEIMEDAALGIIEEFTPHPENPDTWDLDSLYRQLFTVFPVPAQVTPETLRGKNAEELEEAILGAIHEAYDLKAGELGEEVMPKAERLVMLNAMDQYWRRHLTDLDILREGIGLMSVAQRDPVVEYKREAFSMWQSMQGELRAQAARNLFRVQVNAPQMQARRNIRAMRASVGGEAAAKPQPVRKTAKQKVRRNDPCWCGSGKKYKHCHLREDRAKAAG